LRQRLKAVFKSFIDKVEGITHGQVEFDVPFRDLGLVQPEKIADISGRHHWFSRQMTSEKRALKFHDDDASLPRSG